MGAGLAALLAPHLERPRPRPDQRCGGRCCPQRGTCPVPPAGRHVPDRRDMPVSGGARLTARARLNARLNARLHPVAGTTTARDFLQQTAGGAAVSPITARRDGLTAAVPGRSTRPPQATSLQRSPHRLLPSDDRDRSAAIPDDPRHLP